MWQVIVLLVILLLIVTILAYPLGVYLAKIANTTTIYSRRWLAPIENFIYRLAGTNPPQEMTWQTYSYSLLMFNLFGVLVVFSIQCLQNWLPLNPQQLPAISPDLALNTAVSFVTNTNWQNYSGEQTMSYFTQMVALSSQNFFSAATGLAVVFALIRGFSSSAKSTIGNFWVDLTRSTLYLLLPLATILAIFFMSQGVIQNFSPYKKIFLLAPFKYIATQNERLIPGFLHKDLNIDKQTHLVSYQTLPMGPVASQEAIKVLGSNGGGFFNANSAHPYENPTPLTNLAQIIAMLIIPFAICFAFGILVNDKRQGWLILGTMITIFIFPTTMVFYAEQQNPYPPTILPSNESYLGNMEGKETRFGINLSALFAAVTTSTSCGATNSVHDSYSALGSIPLLLFMQLSEVIFGGVGSGLYSMLLFVIMAVFIAGLMIGRTPSYLGKKIQSYEIKMTAIAVLITPTLVLIGTACAILCIATQAAIGNPGPHGFSEILYNFTSAGNNNGSAFAGLNTNTTFYNLILAIIMWCGRFGMIIPILAMAGSLAAKQRLSNNTGALPTNTLLFGLLLAGTLLLVGMLNYIPALVLGPIVDYLTGSHT